MTYKYAVIRGRLVLDRAMTAGRARKIAVAHIGAVVVALSFVTGCKAPEHGGLVPCDIDDCGKSPLDKRP